MSSSDSLSVSPHRYALHFLVQSGLTYSIMMFAGLEHMHKLCFIVALGYLSFCQITRVYVFDYGMYSADFTGPMMVITQKITSLAFEIHDGLARKEEQLTPSQRCLAVRYVIQVCFTLPAGLDSSTAVLKAMSSLLKCLLGDVYFIRFDNFKAQYNHTWTQCI
ncbi:lysophospholipid acyltransferase 2-like [Salvelinus fontinalis]|uniref:lysophospholipid acyltransferase 2-like n=1 Tax=Salvelinus fontinalis TaxID=8038 RepID=UPI002486165A|nr:lysophospholipid acyltransferase 2-like [Salvelinus fontinalis]